MKIVFFGTPSFVIPILKTLAEHFTVVGVVTAPDAIVGRRKILTPSAVKTFVQNNNIPTLQFEKLINGKSMENEKWKMKNLNPDLFVVAAYGKIIPKHILNIPHLGAINIHPSLLPKYRGPSPIQAAILNGDNETGITFIQMDEELDHGPIISQEVVPLKGDETSDALHQKLFQKAAGMLPATIQQISNKIITPTPQDESKVVYCKKITKQDGYFDIENPPSKEILDRMIRAYYPWPTAWTQWKMENSPRASGDARRGEAGGKWKILKFLPEKKIQIEGGKPMSVKDFLNGYPQCREKLTWLLGLVEER